MQTIQQLKKEMDDKRALWVSTLSQPAHIFNRAFENYNEARMLFENEVEENKLRVG